MSTTQNQDRFLNMTLAVLDITQLESAKPTTIVAREHNLSMTTVGAVVNGVIQVNTPNGTRIDETNYSEVMNLAGFERFVPVAYAQDVDLPEYFVIDHNTHRGDEYSYIDSVRKGVFANLAQLNRRIARANAIQSLDRARDAAEGIATTVEFMSKKGVDLPFANDAQRVVATEILSSLKGKSETYKGEFFENNPIKLASANDRNFGSCVVMSHAESGRDIVIGNLKGENDIVPHLVNPDQLVVTLVQVMVSRRNGTQVPVPGVHVMKVTGSVESDYDDFNSEDEE